MTPQEREREARQVVWVAMQRWFAPGDRDNDCGTTAALDAYRSAVEARVRWEQQADAEGYTEGRPQPIAGPPPRDCG